MSAFDLYIYSVGAFAIVASILMHWPKVGGDHKRDSSPVRRQSRK
jgi:hypothetical protein